MSDTNTARTRPSFLLLVGLLSALLFIAMLGSVFVRGPLGIALASLHGFGMGFLSTAARSRRPSLFWTADLVGSLIGAALAILMVREVTLQPRHYFNQWALFALPIAATCGGVLASQEIVAEAIDRVQPRRR